MNIDEIMFYLKYRYSDDNRDQITFIQGIPSQRDVPTFEGISEEMKVVSKHMEQDEGIQTR